MNTMSTWTKRLGRASVPVIGLLAAAVIGTAACSSGANDSKSEGRPTAVPQDARCDSLRAMLGGHITQAQRDSAYACARRIDVALRARADSTVGEDLSLARAYSSIPEYHDEQRLPDGLGALGPKAGIYASPHLGGFTTEWQYAEHGDTGVFVAHVYVELDKPGEEMPSTYRDLGLSPGLNCVWMVHKYPVPNNDWVAYVRPASYNGAPPSPAAAAECDPKYGTATQLTVKRQTPAGAEQSAYPAVARFDESTAGAPLLGVKCLAGWCEMGADPSFVPRQPLPVQLGVSGVRARVKGWHDEQVLSLYTAGRWVPSGVRAAVVPEPTLDMRPDRFDATWVEVAKIYLESGPADGSKYATWGLVAGAQGNRLLLHRISADRWNVMLRRPGQDDKEWRFVDRCVHKNVVVPGTARFRWTWLDDGIWVPCGQACCQVEGEQ